jgi:hypothetical protein
MLSYFIKNKIYFFLLLSVCLLSTRYGFTQEKKKDSSSSNSYGKLSLSYLNNAIYNGRKDSLTTPYITPSIGYYDKSGFYVSGALSYLSSAKESRIDLFSLDIGYNISITNQLSSNFYANKSFYNQSSTAVKSDIKGSLGAAFNYDLSAFQLNLATEAIFSQKTDLSLNLGLGHAFNSGDADHLLSINPSVNSNWSTLNFYEGFTSRKVSKKIGQTVANLASATATTTVDKNRFTLLDYELSVPLSYDTKTFGFYLTPTFAIPQNPINTTTSTVIKLKNGTQTTQVQNSTPLSEKTLENSFYFELGIYIKF